MWANEGDDVGASGSPRPDVGGLPVGEPLVRSRLGPPSGATVPFTAPTGRPADDPAAADGHHVVGAPTVAPGAAPEPVPRVAPVGGPSTALVVGAASPLGTAFTAALRARGARVCLLDDDAGAVRSVVGDDPDAMVLRCDLSRPDDVLDATGFLRRAGLRIDLLVQTSVGSVPSVGDVPAGPTARELDDRYRREVSGPLWLLEAAAALLGPGATVVVADSGSVDAADPVDAARARAVQVARDVLGDRASVLHVVVAGGSPSEDRAAAALALDLAGLDRVRVTAVEVRPVGPPGGGGSLPA